MKISHCHAFYQSFLSCMSGHAMLQGSVFLAYLFVEQCSLPSLVAYNFLWCLFISMIEPIFVSVLLAKILLLYPTAFSMLNFKLLGSIYMPVHAEKYTFDNTCSKTPDTCIYQR